MGEPVDIISPVPNCKDNWADVASCSRLYDTLNDLSSSLSVGVSGINSAENFITDSAAIPYDKPVNNSKKKKKKKKGKKNAKYLDNASTWTEPRECDQGIRTPFQPCNPDDKTASCHKHNQLIPPLCVHETYEACLKDATNNNRKLIPECLFCGPFEHTGNFVNSAYRNAQGDTVICCRGIKKILTGVEEPEAIEKNITLHCTNGCIRGLKGNFSHGDLSHYLSHGTDSIMCSTSEGSNGDTTQLSIRNMTSRNTYAENPSGHNNVLFQNNILDRTRCRHHIQSGKENTVWQKNKKPNRDPHKHGVKMQNHIYVPKDAKSVERNLLLNYDSFSNNGLLPTPIVPTAHHAFSHQVIKNKQGMYIRTHCNVLVESSQWNHHRCHSGHSQIDSELRQDETAGDSKGEGNLKEKRKVLYKHENLSNGKRHSADFKANFYKFRSKTCLSQRDSFEISRQLHRYNNQDFSQSINHNRSIQLDEPHCSHPHSSSVHTQFNFQHSTISDLLDYTLFPGIQPYNSMKIPRNEAMSVESLQDSLDKLQKDPFYFGIKSSYEDKIRQDLSSRVSLQKWVPVGKKDSEVLKKVESVCSVDSLKYVRSTCNENADLHVEKLISVPVSVDPEKTCLLSNDKPKMMTIESESSQLSSMCKNIEHSHGEEHARGYAPQCNMKEDTSLLCIGSQMAMEILNASYRLQIVSENIQLTTGTPLAEFEKLLELASPVIALSSSLQYCDVCSRNCPPLTSICKHQLANIWLREVWSWYEKPGNYGLEVRAEDSKNLKRVDINSKSFNAHFVPFLSAIQLFGYSQTPRSSNNVGDLHSENREGGDEGLHYFHTEGSIDGAENSASTISGDVYDFSSLSSPPCSNGMELLFEFFENEQPQQRKPLYDKVMDILKVGTSNHQVFGDPSKLDCLNFHNIHPASWYSVAWYPIYRIPEGNLRASFLTYHSLGHLVQIRKSESRKENPNCVISPVLGMQSYNSQGECWFSPKSHVDSSPCDSSEILKERLRMLEETARILARGCVYKGHVKVTNRQPDFEFFLSRKR